MEDFFDSEIDTEIVKDITPCNYGVRSLLFVV